MKRRKNRKIVEIMVFILVIIVGAPFGVWFVQPSKTLDVVIIDKTVPDTTYREHKGLMWILNNLKVNNGELNKPFKYEEDYYGFFPLNNEQYTIKEIPDNLGKPDLIYLTDTYGVYKEDFYNKSDQGNRSGIIYGGTQEKEVTSIKNALDHNVIIGEFNILASPTESQARADLENIFGIKWNNWMGRYFSDLSKENLEIPAWMKENYAMQYGIKWDFTGAGIVLVGADDTIIVLRNNVELGKDLNSINFSENVKNEFPIRNNTNYYYWFEIASADKDTEVLANYKLDVTEAGQKILDEYEIPTVFPAIVRKTGPYTSYYFAGDFADSKSTPSIYNMPGIPFLNRITTFDEDSNQNYFYWNVYYPLIEKIISSIN
ncbi:hypothetical protein GH810_13740 [Acetobacterium paludosum]|uniref:Uncharacterized protein n=1 Tax=Acetobacterium paludosum TaxID=52693 RepID=A0A923KTF7_9FIRM|nr:hypothetical protein [Acetobacterium paludosum]MBC3889372.1 hypothetical protein [Acetobacterium paludosum]